MMEQQNITEQPAAVQPKRRRGAPKGNQNARKHGFYSVIRTDDEKAQLVPASAMDGSNAEIATLRVKIASILRHDPHNVALIIRATGALSRLLRTRYALEMGNCVKVHTAMETVLKNITSAGEDLFAHEKYSNTPFGTVETNQEMK